MAYSTNHLVTAGKVSVYTAFVGVFFFAVAFLLNLGHSEIFPAVAQEIATTSVTVLNTPPAWTQNAYEVVESSATNPTNSGSVVTWSAIGTDSNSEDYWLLICSNSATPTPNSYPTPPTCGTGATQWAISTQTTSGQTATAATTTLEAWAESNAWFGWICDGNAGTPRCNNTYTQGINATNSSPFIVNHRPAFSAFVDDSPANPGQSVTFTATASDSDAVGVADTVRVVVCATAGFDTSTDTCTGTTLATSTLSASNPTASYTITIPTQDQNYSAYGYVVDNHGHEASGGAHGTDSTLSVNNVAPTIDPSSISLVQPITTDIVLSVDAGQTTGFVLSFTSIDNNSCDAVGGGVGDEITSYDLSLYRSGIGSTTCGVASALNPNNCYTSGAAPTNWNLSCTASTTSCTGNTDSDMVWNCTFPLWFTADPTDGNINTTQYYDQDWRAQVRGRDDDAATGPLSESTMGVEVESFLAFELNTATIPYGALEPGQQTDPIVATTTIAATGNVGLDKDVMGESMCTTYTTASPCTPSATSTIPENEQRFSATPTSSYAAATPLSSTTPQEIEVNVFKSTSTSSPATGSAYWGIRVPGAITFAGAYTGENLITAILGEPADWE